MDSPRDGFRRDMPRSFSSFSPDSNLTDNRERGLMNGEQPSLPPFLTRTGELSQTSSIRRSPQQNAHIHRHPLKWSRRPYESQELYSRDSYSQDPYSSRMRSPYDRRPKDDYPKILCGQSNRPSLMEFINCQESPGEDQTRRAKLIGINMNVLAGFYPENRLEKSKEYHDQIPYHSSAEDGVPDKHSGIYAAPLSYSERKETPVEHSQRDEVQIGNSRKDELPSKHSEEDQKSWEKEKAPQQDSERSYQPREPLKG